MNRNIIEKLNLHLNRPSGETFSLCYPYLLHCKSHCSHCTILLNCVIYNKQIKDSNANGNEHWLSKMTVYKAGITEDCLIVLIEEAIFNSSQLS